MKQKSCTKCGKILQSTPEYFYRNKNLKSGLHSWCKQCSDENVKNWLTTNKGRKTKNKISSKYKKTKKGKFAKWKYDLKRYYGLSVEEYNKILESQNSSCMICGGSGVRRMAVDHNHKTGKIRGLLCNKCNLLIGYAKDNPLILVKTIKYLEGRL